MERGRTSLSELLSKLQLDRPAQEPKQKLFEEFSLKGVAELIQKIQASDNSMWEIWELLSCIHIHS